MASESMYAPRAEQAGSSNGPLDHADGENEVPAHPYLAEKKLYISELDASIADKELASSVFSACLPVRLQIDRTKEQEGEERLSGTVEFQTLDKAEKALATIRSPRLSIHEDASQDPKPAAKPRLIKQLPHGTEDSDVYDLFRPFGALESAARILTNPLGHHTGFRGMALVIYYNEEDAQRAQEEMHCAEVEGKTISVVIDNVARRPSGQAAAGFSASAAPFIPGGASSPLSQSMSANAPAFHPPTAQRGSPGGSPMFVPGTNLQYSTQAATYVDPCNLFCKNLDPAIDSNELFTLFKGFGKIVSARVMRDERGVSREFGFVSYRRPEDASKALSAMNGTQHGTKQMIVRLHEPKNVRQEKLSHKFGSAYAPDSPNDFGSAGNGSDNDAGPGAGDGQDNSKPRRMSNSYFRAAASGENGQVDLGQLQGMNATLRGDILRGGFSRKVKELDDVRPEHVDILVAELSKLKLPEAVEALNDRSALVQKVTELRETNDGSLLSVPASTSAGDSASISSIGAAAGTTERERLLYAVKAVSPADSPVEDITDMLVGLPKKERAMALFNQDYLRVKIDEAKQILEMGDDNEGDGDAVQGTEGSKSIVEPVTSPIVGREQAGNGNGNGAGSSSSDKSYTLADLAKLPASEIVQLAGNPQSSGLPLPKADPSVVKETDSFIDGLKDLPAHDQKQKLGDLLFKKIRTFGFKGAPKITIALLDSEDLRSLAHLMNSYPECLREKVALQSAKSAK